MANSLNYVDCTRAPNCTTLRRSYCFKTTNTCGSCLPGLIGREISYLASNSSSNCSPIYRTPLTFYFTLDIKDPHHSLHTSHFVSLPPITLHLTLTLLLILSNACVLGVIGDSNVLCRTVPKANDFQPRRSRTLLTTTCSAGSDCLYGQCTNNICTTPDLLCPTSVIGMILFLSYTEQMTLWAFLYLTIMSLTFLQLLSLFLLHCLGSVCSGNGACVYSDPSGSVLKSCLITDVRCTATCACTNGFGGADCTLTSAALVDRSDLR